MVSVSRDRQAVIYDLRNFGVAGVREELHARAINFVVIEGQHFLTGSRDKTVKLSHLGPNT